MRVSLAAVLAALVAFSLLGLSGLSYRLGLAGLPTAFAMLRWGAYAGIATMLVALAAGGWAYRLRAKGPGIVAILAFAAGAVAFGLPFSWQQAARRVPPIHDITTDIENPPTFVAIVPLRAGANPLDRSAEVDDEQRRGYPDIQPLTLGLRPQQAFDRALQAAQALGWEIVAADSVRGTIEATDTTRWFGFKDDVVIRLTPWGSATRVDVRSVSRIGRSDVGTNARRIRSFLRALAE